MHLWVHWKKVVFITLPLFGATFHRPAVGALERVASITNALFNVYLQCCAGGKCFVVLPHFGTTVCYARHWKQ